MNRAPDPVARAVERVHQQFMARLTPRGRAIVGIYRHTDEEVIHYSSVEELAMATVLEGLADGKDPDSISFP
jgi:hypothetical protein